MSSHWVTPQYIYQDSKLLAPVVNIAERVYGQFLQSNMHSTFDFCPQTS